jgi:rhodanese-related sulfurtransferase
MPSLLIDVRSPAEYATGYLHGAINIEYTQIRELAARDGVRPDDEITLYCRSGRRSAIALGELQGLGFTNVRDIGSLETAEGVLEEERRAREHEEDGAGAGGAGLDATGKRDIRNAFEDLVAGLGGEGGQGVESG